MEGGGVNVADMGPEQGLGPGEFGEREICPVSDHVQEMRGVCGG